MKQDANAKSPTFRVEGGTLIRACLALIALVVTITALYVGKPILAPIILALVFGVVVAPLAARLASFGIPRIFVASTLLILAMAFLGLLLILIGPLVEMLSERLPFLIGRVTDWFENLSNLLRGFENLNEEIERTVGTTDTAQTDMPTLSDALWLAPNFVGQLFIFMGVLFFFVLTRDELYASAPHMVDDLRRADRAVSRYFGAVTLVNTGLGVATAIAMALIGLQYPVLWGLAAAILNFILYLGPMTLMVSLLIAGLIQLSGPFAFLPPAVFLLLNMTEAQFVTPLVVGQHLSVNPLIVFLAIVFGLWLWGPVGAVVALPALLWLNVLLSSRLAAAPDTIPDDQ